MTSLAPSPCQPAATVKLAVFYLLLPNILFFAGWVHSVWAVAFISIIAACFFTFCRSLPGRSFFDQELTPVQKWTQVLMFAFWSFGLIFLCGFGGTVVQASDFFVRNSMYHELVVADWPLIHPALYPDNIPNFFVYSLGSDLPPAFFSKLIPLDPNTIRSLWYGAGLFLFCLLLAPHLKKRIFLFLIVVAVVNGLFVSSRSLGDVFPETAAWWFDSDRSCFHMGSLYTGVMHTFHLSIPAYLMIALLLTSSIPRRYLLFVSSLLLFLSPLSAITLFPWIAYLLLDRFLPLQSWKKIWASLRVPDLRSFAPALVGVLIFVVAVLYYKLGAGSRVGLLFHTQNMGSYAWTHLAFSIVALILIPWALMKPHSCGRMYQIMILVTLGCYLIHVGTPGRNNELILKNSYYCSVVTAWCLTRNYRNIWLLAAYCLLSAIYMIQDISGKVASLDRPAADNVLDTWGNHVFHPEDPIYVSQFSAKRATSYPQWLFYGKAGESAESLLRPFATGRKSDDPSWYRAKLLPSDSSLSH